MDTHAQKTAVLEVARLRKTIKGLNLKIQMCREQIRYRIRERDQDGQHYWQRQLFCYRLGRTAKERELLRLTHYLPG